MAGPGVGARNGVVHTIEASFETVTPAYVGGAPDGVARPAEVRVPNLLGVLRFWWRALEWGRVLAEAPPAATGSWHERYAQPLKCLRQREDRLFGAAGTGQGLILASLAQVSTRPGDERPQRGAAYLAGQGLKGRDAIGAGSVFTLRLVVRRRKPGTASDAELSSLTRAVRCLGLLGGFGARSRRGFGSLVLRRITDSDGGRLDWQQPCDLDAYRAELASLTDGTWTREEPPFTAFSTGSRLTLIPAGAEQFLETQGHLFQLYRSKGSRDSRTGTHMVNGVAVDTLNHRFKSDFDWFDDLLNWRGAGQGPERAIFGLPHNYFSKSRGKAEVAACIPETATHRAHSDRRASPLFLHIHKLGDGQLVAAWLFLPAVFLPAGPKGRQLLVTVDRKKPTTVDYVPCWVPITDFYGALAKQPGCVTVWP